MRENYKDITSSIKEDPIWYDENGTPRYWKFTPALCPDIYSRRVVLLKIACQYCGEEFDVEMSSGWGDKPGFNHPPGLWHYGDPPAHRCVGDTMNCEDLEVLEVWTKENTGKWERSPEFEVVIDEEN